MNYNPNEYIGDINSYAQWTEDMWFSGNSVPEGAPTDFDDLRELFIMATGLAGEAGEIMEKLKKYVRDGTLDKEALKLEFGDTLYYWSRLLRKFGISPAEVMRANVDKIESRHERGTMRGSGDYR